MLGDEVNGARLSIRLGPLSGQPSELLKVILVVFLAAYLADNRPLLARASLRLGPIPLPPLPYLLPMLAMWGIALALVIVQRDLGAALLLFSVFLALLYIATRRGSYVVVGVVLFVVGAALLYSQLGHVRTRVDIWLDPWADPLGCGLPGHPGAVRVRARRHPGHGPRRRACRRSAACRPSRSIHTDFVFAALGEELGLLGALAIGACYLVIAERGLRIAARAPDEFQALLAAGLTLVVVLQAALIMAANLRLVPLTGVTLPFVSYGGSSVLTNALVVGPAAGAQRPAGRPRRAGAERSASAARWPPDAGAAVSAAGLLRGSGRGRSCLRRIVAHRGRCRLVAGGPGGPAQPTTRATRSSWPPSARRRGAGSSTPAARGRRQRPRRGRRPAPALSAPGHGAHHRLQERPVRDRRAWSGRTTGSWSGSTGSRPGGELLRKFRSRPVPTRSTCSCRWMSGSRSWRRACWATSGAPSWPSSPRRAASWRS